MGFIVCSIHSLDAAHTRLQRLHRIAFGGAKGCLARHLPALASSGNGEWTLSADMLLRLEHPEAANNSGIFFELAAGSDRPRNVMQLIKVSGRTASIITDAIFHFKVLGPAEPAPGHDDSFIVNTAAQSAERYEQMRLDGGTKGGTWAWSEPQQALAASVLNPIDSRIHQ